MASHVCRMPLPQTQVARISHSRPSIVRRPAVLQQLAVPVVRDFKTSSVGGDAVGGWLDLAKLVSGGGGSKTPYDSLASDIGRDVYVDIAGWHLYTRDVTAAPGLKISQALAVQLGPQASKGLREADVEAVLKKVPIKLGGGKLQVSLYEVMPSAGVRDLTRLLEDFGRR